MKWVAKNVRVGDQKLHVHVIGVSLSELHTSMTSVQRACVCLLAWTDH